MILSSRQSKTSRRLASIVGRSLVGRVPADVLLEDRSEGVRSCEDEGLKTCEKACFTKSLWI